MQRIALCLTLASILSAPSVTFAQSGADWGKFGLALGLGIANQALQGANNNHGHNHNHQGGGNGVAPYRYVPNGSGSANAGGFNGNGFFPGNNGGGGYPGNNNYYPGNNNYYPGNNYYPSNNGYQSSRYASSYRASSPTTYRSATPSHQPRHNAPLRHSPPPTNYSNQPIEIYMPDWCEGECHYQLTNSHGGVYDYTITPGGVQRLTENSEWTVRFHDGYEYKSFRVRGGQTYEFRRDDEGAWAFYAGS